MFSHFFTNRNIKAALKKMKKHTVPGKDGVRAFMLKKPPRTMVSAIRRMFQVLFNHSYLPEEWRTTLLAPLFKSGDRTNRANYRPIGLSSLLGRLSSRVVHNHEYSRQERAGQFSDEQGGFRRRRGSPEMVLALKNVCHERTARKQATFVAFHDVRKAYDCVNRARLLYKLMHKSIDGPIYRYIQALLTNTRMCLQKDGLQSEWFETTLGVIQGDILSPLLFAAYIDGLVEALDGYGIDLGDGLKKLAVLLFADDIVILANSASELQAMLDISTAYAAEWRFKFSTGMNQDKSAVMVFGSGKTAAQLTTEGIRCFFLGGDRIPLVDHYKYLGVILQADGKWDRHFAKIQRNVRVRAEEMRRAGMHKYGNSPVKNLDLLRMEINPLMEYAAGVWEFNAQQCASLRADWNKCARAAVGVPKYTSIDPLLHDLGTLQTPSLRRLFYKLTMYHRVSTLKNDRIVRRAVFFNWRWRVQMLRVVEEVGMKEDCKLAVMRTYTRGDWRIHVQLKLQQYAESQFHTRLTLQPHLQLFAELVDPVDSLPKVGEHILQYLRGPRGQRQFTAVLRAQSLPVQACKPAARYYRCGGADAGTVCFMCRCAPETTMHFLCECVCYNSIKESLPEDLRPLERQHVQLFMAEPSSPTSCELAKMWYDMWRLRVATWRRRNPRDKPVFPGVWLC